MFDKITCHSIWGMNPHGMVRHHLHFLDLGRVCWFRPSTCEYAFWLIDRIEDLMRFKSSHWFIVWLNWWRHSVASGHYHVQTYRNKKWTCQDFTTPNKWTGKSSNETCAGRVKSGPMEFPIIDLLDKENYTQWIIAYVHPNGFVWPTCQVEIDQAREFRTTKRGKRTVYHCQRCQGAYNLYTGIVFQQHHLSIAPDFIAALVTLHTFDPWAFCLCIPASLNFPRLLILLTPI